jgi:hypothetical protein
MVEIDQDTTVEMHAGGLLEELTSMSEKLEITNF